MKYGKDQKSDEVKLKQMTVLCYSKKNAIILNELRMFSNIKQIFKTESSEYANVVNLII